MPDDKKKGAKEIVEKGIKIVLEGTTEALARMGAENALARLFGGTPTTTSPATATPATPTASLFDIKAAAQKLLGSEQRAQFNTDAASRAAELNGVVAAHDMLKGGR